MICLPIALPSTVVPRSVRIRFWLLRAAKWLVPAERCLILPLAERRNRFFVPLCVFCLGMAAIQTELVSQFIGNLRVYRFRSRAGREKHASQCRTPEKPIENCLKHALHSAK